MLVLAMTVTSLGAPGAQAATKSKNYVSPYEGKKYVLPPTTITGFMPTIRKANWSKTIRW